MARMKKRIASILQYTFFLLLGFGLIWYSSKDLNEEQMTQLKASFGQTRYLYMVPVIAALLLSHYSRALRWRLLMHPLGYYPTRANTYLTVLIGYFFNLLVPRLGEVMKCTLLAKYEKVPADKLIGTIVAERAIDVVCLLAITLFMVISQFSLLGASTLAALRKLFTVDKIPVLLMYLGAIVAIVFLLRWFFQTFKRFKLVLAIQKFIRGIGQGLGSIRRIHQMKAFILHTIIIWAGYIGSIWLGFRAFPEVAHLGMDASVAILVFGSVGMMATQGGIGAYQFAVQKTLLLNGIGAVSGLAFGWVLWGAQTAIVLLAGILALLLLPIINRTRHA